MDCCELTYYGMSALWMIAITIAYSEVLRQKAEIELNFALGIIGYVFWQKIVAIELSTNFSCFPKRLIITKSGENITIKLNLRFSVNSFTRLNLFQMFLFTSATLILLVLIFCKLLLKKSQVYKFLFSSNQCTKMDSNLDSFLHTDMTRKRDF